MENVLVVYNPKAGRKKALKYKKTLIEFFIRKKINHLFVEIETLKTIDVDNYDTIIAVGGDGTVNKVIPYIINTEKVLGIVPCGTANLLAAKLGIFNIKQAIKYIQNSNISKIDIVCINDEYSVLRVGFGYDADIICKTPQSLKNTYGYFSYFIAGILFALRLKKKEYKVVIDGIQDVIKVSCIIIANAGNMYRNIVSVSNKCRLDDGKIDLFLMNTSNPIVFFFEFLKIIFNYKVSNNVSTFRQISNIEIENDFCNLHIDGEKVKIKDNIKINVIPHSVNIFSNF